MGKIVKYCGTCEEGFAEKFGFCPNCGAGLQAFEMNPLAALDNAAVNQAEESRAIEEPQQFAEEVKIASVEPDTYVTSELETGALPANSFETVPGGGQTFVADASDKFADAAPIIDEVQATAVEPETFEPETTEEETKTFAAGVAAAGAGDSGNNYQSTARDAGNYNYYKKSAVDDGYYVTVIEEKNVGQRNALLLGTLVLMCTLAAGGLIYSLFNKSLLVGAIEQGDLIAFVPEVEPVPMDEVEPPKKEKDDGGGGGGGGREEKTEVQQGRLANQTPEKPLIAPDKNMTPVTKPEIPIQAATQGNIKRPITNEQYGLPNATGVNSAGMGSGGGMGEGRGTGMGTGIGTGEGSGTGSGSGSGNGNGNGSGDGDGSGSRTVKPPPPVKPKAPPVTVAFKILAKPRANYTDAARQNQVQGTVTLRVTFLASGQIGSISPVSGLPYGLTEQAIAAARSIKFEPQKVDGVGKSVTKQVQYSFTIY